MIDVPVPGQQYKVNSILDLSPSALGELRAWLEGSGFQLPISQVVGFKQFTAQADVDNSEARRNTNTYGDPTTGNAGPELTGLPDGKYVLFYGALAWDFSGGGGTTYMAPKVNSTEATNADAVSTTANTAGISVMRAVLKDLTGGSNTVTLRYNMSTGTGRWDNRFLIALRYANK